MTTDAALRRAELTYRLFYADGANSTNGMPNGGRFSHLEFQSLGATINAACDLIKRGCGVWRIESQSGLIMERSDVEVECVRRAQLKR